MRTQVFLLVLLLLAGCTMTTAPPTTTGSGIEGRAMVGPTCPVERNPPDPNCADKPYHGSLAVAAASDGHIVKTFETDVAGNFTVALEPGSYTIQNADGASMLPRCATETIMVRAGAYTHVEVSCDSGIR